MENLAKQLKIKIGSLKRIQKEYSSYQKEEEKQREKIKTLELAHTDEYTIKKQVISLFLINFIIKSLERSIGRNRFNVTKCEISLDRLFE